jgi:hypothetical protein
MPRPEDRALHGADEGRRRGRHVLDADEPSAGLEYAQHFAHDRPRIRDRAEHEARDHRLHAAGGQRQSFRTVAVHLELDAAAARTRRELRMHVLVRLRGNHLRAGAEVAHVRARAGADLHHDRREIGEQARLQVCVLPVHVSVDEVEEHSVDARQDGVAAMRIRRAAIIRVRIRGHDMLRTVARRLFRSNTDNRGGLFPLDLTPRSFLFQLLQTADEGSVQITVFLTDILGAKKRGSQ